MSEKKRKKLIRLLTLCTVIILMFAGIVMAEPAFPIIVTDDVGNSVVFQKTATRIVSLVPSHTEILFALGAGDQVVAVDEYSDWPLEATKKAKIGNLTGIDYEYLISLEPDLVLGLASHAKSGVSEKIENLGIPVLILEPQNFTAVYETIELLGKVTGHTQEAEDIIASMKEKVAYVQSRVAFQKPRRVFYEVWPEPLMTAGPGSFVHELITIAKGENIAADADSAWPMFSLETLLAKDPEVIITTFDQTIHELDANTRSLWAGITAVRENRYYKIDPNIISRPGPRLADGLVILAKFIHPEVF